jgi:hypothetical protein
MIDDATLQRGIYAVAVPAGLAALAVGVTLLVARFRHSCRRSAAWAVPLAASLGIAIAFVQPFHELREPGSFNASAWLQWMWVIPASLAILILWPAFLLVWPAERGRRWFWGAWTALGLAAVGGVLAGLGRYEVLSTNYLYVVPVAVAGMAVLLYPAAVRDATPADAIACGIAVLIALPALALTGYWTPAMLLAPAGATALTAGIVELLIRSDRYAEWRHGVSAGAMAVPMLLPVAAVLTWFGSFDLTATWAVALGLPSIACVVAVYARRFPGVMAVVIAAVMSFAGLAITYTQTDLRVYGLPAPWEFEEAEDEAPAAAPPVSSEDELGFWSRPSTEAGE